MNPIFYIFCIGLIFIVAGIRKIFNFLPTTIGLSSRVVFNMLPSILHKLTIIGVIAVEILAPLGMLYGVYNSEYSHIGKLSCISLIAFTALASILYHNPVDPSQRTAFLKNLSIIGGLGCALSYYN